MAGITPVTDLLDNPSVNVPGIDDLPDPHPYPGFPLHRQLSGDLLGTRYGRAYQMLNLQNLGAQCPLAQDVVLIGAISPDMDCNLGTDLANINICDGCLPSIRVCGVEINWAVGLNGIANYRRGEILPIAIFDVMLDTLRKNALYTGLVALTTRMHPDFGPIVVVEDLAFGPASYVPDEDDIMLQGTKILNRIKHASVLARRIKQAKSKTNE